MSEEENKEITAPSTVFKTEVTLKEEKKKKTTKVFRVDDAEPPDDAPENYSKLPDNVLLKQIVVSAFMG